MKQYDQALSLKVRFPNAGIGKGTALNLLEMYEDALTAYNSASNVTTNNTKTLLGKGTVFHNLGKEDESYATFPEAFIIDPSSRAAEHVVKVTTTDPMVYSYLLPTNGEILKPGYLNQVSCHVPGMIRKQLRKIYRSNMQVEC